jgi:hypothetical protein
LVILARMLDISVGLRSIKNIIKSTHVVEVGFGFCAPSNLRISGGSVAAGGGIGGVVDPDTFSECSSKYHMQCGEVLCGRRPIKTEPCSYNPLERASSFLILRTTAKLAGSAYALTMRQQSVNRCMRCRNGF